MHGHMSYQNILYLHKLLDPYSIAFSLKAEVPTAFHGSPISIFLANWKGKPYNNRNREGRIEKTKSFYDYEAMVGLYISMTFFYPHLVH